MSIWASMQTTAKGAISASFGPFHGLLAINIYAIYLERARMAGNVWCRITLKAEIDEGGVKKGLRQTP